MYIYVVVADYNLGARSLIEQSVVLVTDNFDKAVATARQAKQLGYQWLSHDSTCIKVYRVELDKIYAEPFEKGKPWGKHGKQEHHTMLKLERWYEDSLRETWRDEEGKLSSWLAEQEKNIK